MKFGFYIFSSFLYFTPVTKMYITTWSLLISNFKTFNISISIFFIYLLKFSFFTAIISPFKDGPMLECSQVSTSSTIDFLLHRNPSYMYEVTFGAWWELGKRFCGQQKCPLIGDKELYKCIMITGTCEGLKSPHCGKYNFKWIQK